MHHQLFFYLKSVYYEWLQIAYIICNNRLQRSEKSVVLQDADTASV